MLLQLLGAVLAAAICIYNCYIPKHSSKEPPIIASSVPYIGHVLGLLKFGTRYYQRISAKCKFPIYTLPTLNGKIYVVTSVDLVNAVNRNSKTLAFNPFIAQLGKRITGHDEATSKVVQHNLNGENGPGYVTEIHDGTVSTLSPGAGLESMTRAMLAEASSYLQSLKPGDQINLFAWVKRMVTLWSTRAIYGPRNPFSQGANGLVSAFWDFDQDLNKLIIDILPNVTAPKGSRARSKLGLAFQKYFSTYDPKTSESAAMIQARHSTNTFYGLTSWNQGRLEVGVLLGILANTIPTIFYMLIHVLSAPDLLSDIRAELQTTSVELSPDGSARVLNVMTMREKCPLLYSTFQETLRIHALGSSVRYVREDTLLADQYLLKKGNVVQMPMAVMHSDPSAWGSNVNDFEPRRFLKPSASTKDSKTAYRPFGGGASLCPGRHFVTLEAMALVAVFVLRFDVVPVDRCVVACDTNRGEWRIPEQKQESMATNVFPPEEDVRVEIREREGYEGVEWGFEMK